MMRRIFSLVLVCMFSNVALEAKRSPEHKVAILGLGGRSHYLLLECLQVNSNIRVVAACDDHGAESLNWALDRWCANMSWLTASSYKKMFKNIAFYPDTKDGIKKLFHDHPNIDTVMITSANYRHHDHIEGALAHSSCKKMYMEKPLFRNLKEFNDFNIDRDDVNLYIGLTLRYANMTKIVVDNLKRHRTELGAVKKIRSWEHVGFTHGLTIIMMNWRRSINLSGGLLLEKSIHDLDLALYFARSLGVDPREITINTQAAHRLFKKSNQEQIVNAVNANDYAQRSIASWESFPFQRTIPFAKTRGGSIDAAKTIEAVFKDFPSDDNFDGSDIIPDYHKLSATIQTADNNTIDFELEVNMSKFQLGADRGVYFEFEKGKVLVDIMASEMVIELNNGTKRSVDLRTNNSFHAGGDAYIAQALFGKLPDEQHRATFNDKTVQLANFMGLVSEEQATGKRASDAVIKKQGNRWVAA